MEIATLSRNPGDLLSHLRRALAVDQSIYEANHPELFIDLMNLGQLLKESNEPGGAKAVLQRALALAGKTL